MRKSALVLHVAITAVCGIAVASPAYAQVAERAARTRAPTVTELVEEAARATVTIITLDAAGDTLAQGSGFIVRPNGTLVTNWHVLHGAASAVVILTTQERFDRVLFLDGDSTADLAVLKIPGFDLPTLRTASEVPSVGERLYVIGSPLGLSRTVADGIVSAVRLLHGRQLVQMTAPISHGSSGGPVLDRAGRAFAVATLFIDEGQQLNFAVPVRYALGFLDNTPSPRSLAEVFAPNATSDLASLDLPDPTDSPRADLAGTYAIRQTWNGPGPSNGVVQQGFLITANDRAGFMIIRGQAQSAPNTGWNVYAMRALRSGGVGQIMLDAGGVIYDGYQTDGGFVAVGQMTMESSGNTYELLLEASRTTTFLSTSTGPYAIKCRTQYRSGGHRGDYTDWTGLAAVVVANDSVYMDLILANSDGGTTGLVGVAPLRSDGSFVLSDSGNELKGVIRAGALEGEWIDRRDRGARFEGFLRGARN